MALFLLFLANGLSYGLTLFLLSSGVTLIFSMMGVLNFAHASFYMLGAYLGFQISQVTGFWGGLVLAPLMVGVIGGAVERYGLRRVHAHGHVAELLYTFGLAFLIEEIVQLIWGRSAVNYVFPDLLRMPIFAIAGLDYPAFRVVMAAISVMAFLMLLLLLLRTRVGLVVQSALTHARMTAMLGHNVPMVFMSVFAVGSGLAGLAGVLGGAALVTEPMMAQQLGPIVFVIVVIGGLGSLFGAFVASLAVGLLQTFAVGFDRSLGQLASSVGLAPDASGNFAELWSISLSQIAPLLPYMLLILMLVVRPRGIAGKRDL
ncbi:branched-chain amino acid ABC transporter permease [Pseudosulfitobacter pseudonitzschiae]|uniref:branched-chain amino acid ABC transporter permease n=1 Tax=Pseudosulfitobacter pseudonitzschiae TaxID=1402135 RepID=UPI001AF3052D|nr:branched-chain amino acid ABC transporter permease [Pseudosulfitobacter pseudonitzschiae]MBM1816366.1 branched-chain amino acid ABC transporter permease [Pseudosulfitobacter pseudonitzschiae]MBM1832964.1 branched-chain amino acid ABC transporter permease [Pseudosulfitobacter pseudonitzschiae]MBM1837832.1 branched-chain amino acid ABC transporter permease [Pseudosulfitobacter pseudonitzschiae]MBM1843093.1 branched-chain amino acid ABC transporter permease [Pseudosulfitobacter pseudonitzschiae